MKLPIQQLELLSKPVGTIHFPSLSQAKHSFSPLFGHIQQPVIPKRWSSWGMASLPDGETRSLHLVQLGKVKGSLYSCLFNTFASGRRIFINYILHQRHGDIHPYLWISSPYLHSRSWSEFENGTYGDKDFIAILP